MQKHRLMALLLLLLSCLTLLCACRSEPAEPYERNINGTEYEIDPVAQTISWRWGTKVCTYQFTPSQDHRAAFSLTYPDGTTFELHQSRRSGQNVFYEYEPAAPAQDLYPDGLSLYLLLQDEVPPTPAPRLRFAWVSMVLLVFGLSCFLLPQTLWFLAYGWWHKGSEPSQAVLVVTRVDGGIAVVIGIILFFL